MAIRQVTKDMTPADIKAAADDYQELLSKSNVPVKLEQTIADMERRVAEMNNLSLEDWKRGFEDGPAVEVDEPEVPAKGKKKGPERGAVVEIDPNYFYITEKNQAKVATWIKLKRELQYAMHMIVIGPSGCGKTESFAHLGEQFDVPVYKIDCASITTPDRWVGHKELVTVDGQTETRYVKSMMLEWLAAENFPPGIVLFDEINRLPAPLLNTLIPVLDGSKKIWVPDLGIYSTVHPDTMIAATANLGVGYTGTYAMDIALRDRFGAVMNMTFPPQDEEVRLLMRRAGIEEAKAKILVNIGAQARAKANDQTLSQYVSTRSLINAAVWVAAGMKIVDAVDATFLHQFSAEGGADSEQMALSILVGGMAGSN